MQRHGPPPSYPDRKARAAPSLRGALCYLGYWMWRLNLGFNQKPNLINMQRDGPPVSNPDLKAPFALSQTCTPYCIWR